MTCTLQDRLAALHVRPIHHHLPVEAAGAQQGRIQNVGPVRRRDQDDVRVGVKAIHLDQDLVERLLPLVVAAAQPRAPLPAHRVDLINEDDAGRVALGLLEEIAHAAGAHADEHLHELGAGDGEEGHAGLAGDGLRHQRLAGAGRADQEHALRDARAERGELLRLLEEFHDLLQLLFGFLAAGHIGKGDGGLVAGEHARPALPNINAWLPAPCAWRMMKIKKTASNTTGPTVIRIGIKRGQQAWRLDGDLDLVGAAPESRPRTRPGCATSPRRCRGLLCVSALCGRRSGQCLTPGR